MAGIREYITQFGDKTFAEYPFNDCDALTLSELIYMPFERVVSRSFDAEPKNYSVAANELFALNGFKHKKLGLMITNHSSINMVAMANTVEVRRTSPWGIMPTRAATVERMADSRPPPYEDMVRTKSAAPRGAMMMLEKRMMAFRVSWISERTALTYLASALIAAAYESEPTRVTRAHTRPESRKLPERSSEPGAFAMASDSPVSRLSLAAAVPWTTTQSAGT